MIGEDLCSAVKEVETQCFINPPALLFQVVRIYAPQ